MPSYMTGRSWSDPVTVIPGDVIQNAGSRAILICAVEPADPDDSLLVRPGTWFVATAAMAIRVATHGVGVGVVQVAAGLGENDGSEPAEPTAPSAFAGHQWGVATGPDPSTVVLTIAGRPANGGAVLTDLEYTVAAGEDAEGTSLGGTGTGPRKLQMPVPATEYPFRVRAVNGIDPGPWSAVKTATSGATVSEPEPDPDPEYRRTATQIIQINAVTFADHTIRRTATHITAEFA